MKLMSFFLKPHRTFKRIAAKDKYVNPWFVIKELTIEKDGTISTYEMAARADTAVIIIEDDDRNLLFLKQFRFPINDYSWELPMGAIDRDEQPYDAAKRELFEETGLDVPLKLIGEFNPAPGFLQQKAYVFYGRLQCKAMLPINPYEDEICESKVLSLKAIKIMTQDQRITDGFTLTSLALFLLGGFW